MKPTILTAVSILGFFTTVQTQAGQIFKNSFEYSMVLLNDTGIIWAGEYPAGNNTDCTSITITSPQDCNTGRDATDNDPTDGHAGFSFIKLDASGTPLADQSIDYITTPWACVKDNVTGMVWEVKTTTAGIHHKDNAYQWGGLTAIGRDHPNRQGIYFDPSWNELVQGSNTDNLCGFNNWRVPTVAELSSIANKGESDPPTIDTNYFPNTPSNWFWSSSPSFPAIVGNFDTAWISSFAHGTGNSRVGRVQSYSVRLVRSRQ